MHHLITTGLIERAQRAHSHITSLFDGDKSSTVCERRIDALGFYRNAQSIISLHGSVICHMNGNFVSFQNMCEFKRSDH